MTDNPDRELKFRFPAYRLAGVRALAESLCRPDGSHPSARVVTVYYDTRGLDSLHEKLNSDYRKTKIRLRWYDEPTGTSTAFAEVKERMGSRRSKLRFDTSLQGDRLARLELDDPELCNLPRYLESKGVLLPGGLRPLLQLEYRRDRLVEPGSATRISIDSEIRLLKVDRTRMPHAVPGDLDVGVLEIKSSLDSIPPSLRPLIDLGCRRVSFSKFEVVHRTALGLAV